MNLINKIGLMCIVVIVCSVGTVNAKEIKYKIEKFEGSHSIDIETNCYFGLETAIGKNETHSNRIINDLLAIEGVETIYLFKYKINVEVGGIFTLDEVSKEIKKILDKTKFSLISDPTRINCSCKNQIFHTCNINKWYVGQKVWSLTNGWGTVISVDDNYFNGMCPIEVKFRENVILNYTKEGKDYPSDIFPELYPYKVRIVKEEE